MQFVLWRDVLSQHAKAPLHAMVGGGDQIYNDEVFSGKHVQEWLHTGRKVSLSVTVFVCQHCCAWYTGTCAGMASHRQKGQSVCHGVCLSQLLCMAYRHLP